MYSKCKLVKYIYNAFNYPNYPKYKTLPFTYAIYSHIKTIKVNKHRHKTFLAYNSHSLIICAQLIPKLYIRFNAFMYDSAKCTIRRTFCDAAKCSTFPWPLLWTMDKKLPPYTILYYGAVCVYPWTTPQHCKSGKDWSRISAPSNSLESQHARDMGKPSGIDRPVVARTQISGRRVLCVLRFALIYQANTFVLAINGHESVVVTKYIHFNCWDIMWGEIALSFKMYTCKGVVAPNIINNT